MANVKSVPKAASSGRFRRTHCRASKRPIPGACCKPVIHGMDGCLHGDAHARNALHLLSTCGMGHAVPAPSRKVFWAGLFSVWCGPGVGSMQMGALGQPADSPRRLTPLDGQMASIHSHPQASPKRPFERSLTFP